MYVRREAVTIVTDGSGAGTGYTPVMTGLVQTIEYVKDGTTPYSNGVDFTVTVEGTGEAVWTGTDVNATVTVAPRQATHSTTGAASLYAAAGTAVQDVIAIANDRIKIVVASGGDTKTGLFYVVLA